MSILVCACVHKPRKSGFLMSSPVLLAVDGSYPFLKSLTNIGFKSCVIHFYDWVFFLRNNLQNLDPPCKKI